KPVWSEIDSFFARLYGLKDHDQQVIRDTLAVALPYDTARTRACAPPTEAEKRAFVATVKKTLAPFMPEGNGKLIVERVKVPTQANRMGPPFEMLVMTTHKPGDLGAVADGMLNTIISLAEETGATQVFIEEQEGLVVGIYKQYRYWTESRARILCGEII